MIKILSKLLGNESGMRHFGMEQQAQPGGLPPGISQRDCEGPFDPLADFSQEQLWRCCTPQQQLAIVTEFAQNRADDVRDAILEAQSEAHSKSAAGVMSRFLWRGWIDHRDAAGSITATRLWEIYIAKAKS